MLLVTHAAGHENLSQSDLSLFFSYLSAGWRGKIRHQASKQIRLEPSRQKREHNDRDNKNRDGD